MPSQLNPKLEQFQRLQSAAKVLVTSAARFEFLSSLVSDTQLVDHTAALFVWKLRGAGDDPELLSLARDVATSIVLGAGFHYLGALLDWRVLEGADSARAYRSLVNWWAHQSVFEYRAGQRRTDMKSRGVNPTMGKRAARIESTDDVDDRGNVRSRPLVDERADPAERAEKAALRETLHRLLRQAEDQQAIAWLTCWLSWEVLAEDPVWEDGDGNLRLRWRHRAQTTHAAYLNVSTRTLRTHTRRVGGMLTALRRQQGA